MICLIIDKAAVKSVVTWSRPHCHVCHHWSINTSLYPMIGSCTTSSYHVDCTPRPSQSVYHYSTSTMTDCSTCCVYEYALDSLTDSTVTDYGVSSSTIHSAPAVLTLAPHSTQRRDRRDTYVRDRRDEFCCYHSSFYHYQPPYADRYSRPAAAAADVKLAASLSVAKPVLDDTQYWV